MRHRILNLCAIGTAALFVHAPIWANDTSIPPSALIVYPQARAVTFKRFGEVAQVYYQVTTPYPAQEVLKHIQDKLNRERWMPLKEDFLNPGLPSSHVRGWGSYIDGTTEPKANVHQWLAQWKSPEGDIVWYVLKYRTLACEESGLNTLFVIGIYYPSKVADLQRQAANADRSSNESLQTTPKDGAPER